MFVYFYSSICPLQDASAHCWRLGLEDVMVTVGSGGVGDLSGMSLPSSSLWFYTSLTSWSLLLSFMSHVAVLHSLSSMSSAAADARRGVDRQPEDSAVVAAGNAWFTLYRDGWIVHVFLMISRSYASCASIVKARELCTCASTTGREVLGARFEPVCPSFV